MKLLSYTLVSFSCLLSSLASAENVNQDPMNRDPGAQQRLNTTRGMPEGPNVRVLLCADQKSLEIVVPGGHNIYNPKNGKKLEVSFLHSEYSMKPSQNGVKWGEEFPGVFQVMVVPDSPNTHVLVNGITYPGVVICYQVGDRLAAVNHVSLDDFSASVLCNSLLPSLNDTKESIAAFAIALRSKGFEYAQHPKNTFWDIQAASCSFRGNGVLRQDRPYLDGMKVTQRLVLVGKEIGMLSAKNESVASLLASMPQGEVTKMAQNGKNAKEILEQFFPDAIMTTAPTSSEGTQKYLNS